MGVAHHIETKMYVFTESVREKVVSILTRVHMNTDLTVYTYSQCSSLKL